MHTLTSQVGLASETGAQGFDFGNIYLIGANIQ
jgi:hypothetical protein